MSKTTGALITKFVMTLAFAWLTLGFMLGNSPRFILVLALVATALNYQLGDLFILPKFGNLPAALADGLLSILVALIMGRIAPSFRSGFGAMLAFAVLVAVGEYFFHRYIMHSQKIEP